MSFLLARPGEAEHKTVLSELKSQAAHADELAPSAKLAVTSFVNFPFVNLFTGFSQGHASE